MKPKASDYVKIYRALVNLYGAILTDDAYPIIKKYYPEVLKKDLYADNKKRLGKATQWYSVYTTDNHNYLICSDMMDFNDVNYIFQQQEDKPRYVPETLEEFLLYSEPIYTEENDAFFATRDFFVNEFKMDENTALIQTVLMSGRIKEGYRIQDCINDLHRIHEIKTEEELMAFARIFQLLNNNTRMPTNCGHTPNEIRQLSEMATKDDTKIN